MRRITASTECILGQIVETTAGDIWGLCPRKEEGLSRKLPRLGLQPVGEIGLRHEIESINAARRPARHGEEARYPVHRSNSDRRLATPRQAGEAPDPTR
jgi:hypothetical protein